jgi:RNA polymerase sigma-70 factor (ECF subfamily)
VDDSRKHSFERSDATLVYLASEGDSAAFHKLLDRHAEKLFRVALCLTPTRADAEDLLQETLLGAFRSLKTFGGRSSVKTWLISIMTRQAARSVRGLRNCQTFHSIDRAPGETVSGAAPLTVDSGSETADCRMDLISVLKQLSPDRREIIVLRDIDGLSYDEIGEALSIPRGTVESRLYRARADLRQLLVDYVPEEADHATL